jgi:excisionase family DNA binding protein
VVVAVRALPPLVALEVHEARRLHAALVELLRAARSEGVPVPADLWVGEAALAAALTDSAAQAAPTLPTVTVDEYAALTGMHPRTVRRYCGSGRIPARKVGKSWRITRT